MKVKLPNETYLTIEESNNPDYPYEVYVGITDVNDNWIQDLAIVRNAYHYEKDDVRWDDQMEVLVYGDANNEDYTHDFKIDFWKGGM